MGSYNLKYIYAEKKESLDIILVPHSLDETNKTVPTHSQTLIYLIITDLSLK